MRDASLRTPLYQASEDTYFKCEFLHPGRSHKARVAKALVDDAERRGEISPGGPRVLLERTGGNLGISLAMEARNRGYRLTLVTDPHYSSIKREMAARFGAQVVNRGISFPECANNQDVIDILLKERDSPYFYLDQFGNPANPRAHELGTGAEILAQLRDEGHGSGTTVVLVGGLGTGASMRGVSTALGHWFERVVTIGVQPENCDLRRGVYGDHPIQGIAVGQPPPFFPPRELDDVVTVSGTRATEARHRLAREHGFFTGPSSGANVAALEAARALPVDRPDLPRIFVTLLYDRGEDYE
ncbi:MAG: cysteine synthase family protein [Hamadaea sp.]|nr:cysteine synthase family protein [Nonomuraea sp.]NUP62064.1 cysteine synthase family protein [Nonomuraea sp.]NUR72120.1 cysteine synthase family protein [Hamadaea sp.]NUT40987.1 cysteine synthase family protein [Thermoactinospora sp.]